MLIDFSKIDEVVIPNPRGGEGEFHKKVFDTGDNQIILGRLTPGSSFGYHVHEDESETVYYVSGTGTMLYEGETQPIVPGTAHHCPKGKGHNMENTGDVDLVFFAVIPKQ